MNFQFLHNTETVVGSETSIVLTVLPTALVGEVKRLVVFVRPAVCTLYFEPIF